MIGKHKTTTNKHDKASKPSSKVAKHSSNEFDAAAVE
jgi:hypothetical protein